MSQGIVNELTQEILQDFLWCVGNPVRSAAECGEDVIFFY